MVSLGAVTILSLAVLAFADASPMAVLEPGFNQAAGEVYDSAGRERRSVSLDDRCHSSSGHPVSGDPFEKPGDCDNFYQCSNGYLYTMPCAPGTVFNPAIGVCDHPYNVPGCGGTVAPTVPPTAPVFDAECMDSDGQPVSGHPFEKPGDCDHFYQCSNGYLHTMPCAPGTAFNPAIGVCDHPYNVPGCGGTAAPPTTPVDPKCVDSDGNPTSGHPFEKPGDCDHFYQCSNGHVHTMPCAPGTVFNPAIGVCDWPRNVPGCGGTVAPTTTVAPAPTTTIKPFDPKCVDSAGNPVSGHPFEKPGDCDHFYQCSNGYLHTMPCAPGTAFNPAIGVCDWPYNVPGCGGTAAPPTTPVDPNCVDSDGNPISGHPFEKPGDCDHFYQCSNGHVHTMPCAPGTAFNPAIGVCDFPYNVPGCGGTKPPVPPVSCLCFDKDLKPISTGPFEKPGDCEHFYQCSNGYLHTMPCAPGTAFNPAIKVCDWHYNVPGCSGGTSHPPSDSSMCKGGNGEPLSTIPFEKPGSCHEFYQCGAGILYTHSCPPGLVFNPSIKVCDWPLKVPGC